MRASGENPPVRLMRQPSSKALRLGATASSALLLIGLVDLASSAAGAAAPAPSPAKGPLVAASRQRPASPITPDVATFAVPSTTRTTPRTQLAAHRGRSGLAAGRSSASLGAAPPHVRTLVAHVRKPRVDDFAMVGVTWAGQRSRGVEVKVRTRHQGSWSRWARLPVDGDEGPSRSEDVARAGTEPLWVGSATGVEVSVYSRSGSAPRDLTMSAIDPGRTAYGASATGSGTTGTEPGTGTDPPTDDTDTGPDPASSESVRTGTFPGMPRIVTRRQWGADESLGDQCWSPRFGTQFKMVFVHHTAGSNSYTRRESPALVRGIYAYHTQARDWCDIGYNFLVDRYGTVYEGRAGGIRRPVRGAHSGDYNVNTTGISLMGNFEQAHPTRAMKRSLVTLIAWRMGTAYHGAYGRPMVAGKRFARISGHRDAMSTACPGRYVYAWLPRLRERVAFRLGTYQSPIERRWRDLGGPRARFGQVRVGERMVAGGRMTSFAGGRMFSTDRGAFAFRHGPILRKFRSTGGVGGDLGFPTHEVWRVASGRGVGAAFVGGRIYYSHRTDARTLKRGPVLHKYRRLDGAEGALGLPVTAIYRIRDGLKARFQHGSIAWDEATGETTVTYE